MVRASLVSWYLWFLLAVLVLGAATAFIGDEPPDNSVHHESGEHAKPDQAEVRLAA